MLVLASEPTVVVTSENETNLTWSPGWQREVEVRNELGKDLYCSLHPLHPTPYWNWKVIVRNPWDMYLRFMRDLRFSRRRRFNSKSSGL